LRTVLHLQLVGKQPELPFAYQVIIDVGAGDVHV
jgi:hypothetical protein